MSDYLGGNRSGGLSVTSAHTFGDAFDENSRVVQRLRRSFLNAVVNDVALVCFAVGRVDERKLDNSEMEIALAIWSRSS